MLEQRDHWGKRFTVCEEDVDDAPVTRYDHAGSLERARSVSGLAGTTTDNEVHKR